MCGAVARREDKNIHMWSLPLDLQVSEQRKVEALRDPATHADAVGPIEVIETHCSWVFLTHLYAYKMKKAMRLDRMDNRELASRRRSCEEELRLNRRLAASVYLEVTSLNLTDGGVLRLDRPGIPIEWLVKMWRLPRAGFLDRALLEHVGASVDGVAQLLADFYAGQPPVALGPSGYLAKLERQTKNCAAALQAEDLELPRSLVETVLERGHRDFELCRTLLAERARQGRIIEGHGDLKPEHIFLGPPPCIIDCLEFARDLRIVDPLDELAYLAIECERLGADGIAARFINAYLVRARDELDPVTYEFYRVRRAAQRALTLAWHVRDPEVRDRKDWRALAIDALGCVAAPRG